MTENNLDSILAPFREYTPRKHKTVNYERLQELMNLIASAAKAEKQVKKEIDRLVGRIKSEVKSLVRKQNAALEDTANIDVKTLIPKKRRTKEEPKSDGDNGDSRIKVFPTKVSAVAGKTKK